MGTYQVTYNITDANGNAAIQIIRAVEVEDTTAPLITLLGTDPVTIEVGSTYTDAGATASDTGDGNLTGSIVTLNPVNSAVVGSYVHDGSDTTRDSLTYRVSDLSGALSNAATVTVVINPPDPRIVITAGQNFNISESAAPGTLAGRVQTTGDIPTGFAIVGGNIGAVFRIDSQGRITVGNGSSLDYESLSGYTLTIEATAAQSSHTARVAIRVSDANDTAPVIQSNQVFTFNQRPQSGDAMGTVVASDADTVGGLENWRIVAGNDAGIFAIDPVNGQLRVVENGPIHSGRSSYNLQVRVSDGVQDSALETITVEINYLSGGSGVAGPGPTPDPDPDPDPEPEPELEPNPDPEPNRDPEPDLEPESGNSADPAIDPEPDPELTPPVEPEPDFEPVFEPTPDPETVALAEPPPSESTSPPDSMAPRNSAPHRAPGIYTGPAGGQAPHGLPPAAPNAQTRGARYPEITTTNPNPGEDATPWGKTGYVPPQLAGMSPEFQDAIQTMSDTFQDAMQDTEKRQRLVIRAAQGAGVSITLGLILWVLRFSSLIACALGSLPAWRSYDPLPVLDLSKKEREAHRQRMCQAHSEEQSEMGLARVLDPEIDADPDLNPVREKK